MPTKFSNSLRAALLGTFGALMLSGPAFAEADDRSMRAIDADGAFDEAELQERARLLLMADRQPPMPAAQGAVGAAIGQLGFSLLTGGSGASQDLARMREE